VNDVVGVAHVASITNVLASTPALPVRTVAELISYARSRPGELNYASVGIGSSSHLAAELFTRSAGLDVVHVPYRSLTDAFVELHIGRVHYSLFTVPGAMPLLRDGKLRALAVTTPRRSAALPDVPTMAEAGLPEAAFDNWSGIVAPVGTPRRIVEQLHGDIVHILRTPWVREQFARQGAEPRSEGTPDGFMRLMRNEYLRYGQVLREARIEAR
jgi:tripartite-type tricarboxylate transporter receptor subunit TctC